MTDDLSDLPDDVRELIAPHVAETPETLDAISVSIAKRRDEAKAARTSSGIEEVWRDAEEAYVGIDDTNRMEFQSAKWSKPMSMDGPVTTGKKPREIDYKSTAFVRLTARYVDAGAAKLGEILLPVDDKAFSFTETPLPELIKAKEDTSQVVHDGLGNVPLTRAAKPNEMAQLSAGPAGTAAATPPAPGTPVPAAAPAAGAVLPAGAVGPPQVPLTVKDLAEENIELARKKAKQAEKRIYDWMVECQYPAEMRKVIFDAARIGVGVLKAPFPKASRSIAAGKGGKNSIELQIEDRVLPAAKWSDPWNIFPDPACGENIHAGDFIFERDYLSTRQVRDLKKIPGYISTQIDKVLKEGPDSASRDNEASSSRDTTDGKKDRYEIWYYYGTLTKEEMNCICKASDKPLGPDELPPEKEEVYAIVTLINSCVIRATINPLDSGSFPYHSVPWQRRAGSWAGIGVAEQVKMPQKTINAATRAMLNNAGKSAGSQVVIDLSCMVPSDGNHALTPDKIWYKTGDGTSDDVRKAMTLFEIPNVTPQLMTIINYALQLAEESTSIPLITQGQTGPTQPDTYGAAQLQNNNANQLLRSIGYSFDDYITEPVVRQFYEWLLLDPEVPDEEKGDFTINAHGSVALVERYIQDQSIAQMAQMAVQPIYGIDPKKWAKLFLKSKRLDPAELQYTEEEQKRIDEAPQPVAPQVQAAQINQDTQLKLGVMKQTADQQTLQNETQIAAAAQTLESHSILTDATVRLHELQTKHDLALLDYANRHQISLETAKASLAKTAMTLNTQRELSMADKAIDLHKHHNPQPQQANGFRKKGKKGPPQVAQSAAEPAGRAPAGEAFER